MFVNQVQTILFYKSVVFTIEPIWCFILLFSISCFLINICINNLTLLYLLRGLSLFFPFPFSSTIFFLSPNLFQLYLPQTTLFSLNFFYIDLPSVPSSLMTVFITFLCQLYIIRSLSLSIKTATLLLHLTELLIFLCFTVRNLLIFYIFLEFILFTMTILILVYGSRGRKMYASLLFFMYTFLGSLFLSTGIFFLYTHYNTLNFDFFLHSSLERIPTFYLPTIFCTFWIGFSIKLPTMPLHLWLPEAHVEAPTIGSVILAAILLKLGGFGMLRVIVPISHDLALNMRIIPMLFCIISVFYASFLAFRHFDLKKIIAYSSILHMNLSALAFSTESKIALVGAIISMLCHSVVSSALFFTAGFLYEKFKTRNLIYYSSLLQQSSYLYTFFFFSPPSNMAVPFSIAFTGESLLLCGLFQSSLIVFYLTIFSLFFSGLFSFTSMYRLLYSNTISNYKIIQYSLVNQVYISSFSTNNTLSFSITETVILSLLLSVNVLFFFFRELFIENVYNFIALL